MKQDQAIRPRDKGDVPEDPLSRMRHSASHVMADAVKRLRPNAKVAIGPSIENGFYYDFDTEPFAPEDVERIEAEMRKIIAENLPFVRHVVSRAEALERFRSRGEHYKVGDHRVDPRGRGGLVLPARGLHRSLSRPARRAHRRHQGRSRCCRSPAPTGAATSATRSSSASTERRSRRRPSSTSTSRGSRRRSAAITARSASSWTCYSFDDLVGPGLRALAPEGGLRPLPDRGHHPARERPARVPARLHARTSRASSCSKPPATSSTTRTTSSAAWSWTGSATSSSR